MAASFGRTPVDPGFPDYLTEVEAAAGYVPMVTAATAGALPTAAVAYRGTLAVVTSASGVTDALYVCLKATADTYSWRQITTGG